MAQTVAATNARANLYRLLETVNASYTPVVITGKAGNAVLLAESDWNALMETVALHGVPGLAQGIRAGRDEPIDTAPLEC